MIKTKLINNKSKDVSLPCLMKHKTTDSIILVIGSEDNKCILGTVVSVGNSASPLGLYGQWEKQQFEVLPIGFQIELEQR